MGINGLMKLLSDECPGAIREQELKNLTGRKVAIDASMVMYQFLVAVRSTGSSYGAAQLTNDAGEVTSHIQGVYVSCFYYEMRVIHVLRLAHRHVQPYHQASGRWSEARVRL